MNRGKAAPCLRCGKTAPRSRTRPRRFCDPCIGARQKEAARLGMAALRDLERDMLTDADIWRESHEVAVSAEPIYPEGSEYGDALEIPYDALPIVPDRMPDGANSPAGPDEGISTNYEDLAEDLDHRSRQIAKHPWFAENPHWSYSLHDDEIAGEHLRI